MRATFELGRLAAPAHGSVVSIGVFDGVHVGHQAILRANVARARELRLEPCVVTFRQHPKRVLLGRAPPALTTLEHRLVLFRRAGIAHVVALKFDRALRALSARTFVEEVLLGGLGAKHFVLGFDAKFGRDAEGTPEFLARLGLAVEVIGQVLMKQRPISSSAIREAVQIGDLAGAQLMLGRPFAVLGRVVHGDELGRTLGFPTANLNLHHALCPPHGVYATRAREISDVDDFGSAPARPSVTHIGLRPTLSLSSEPRFETHLIDFEGPLYGKRLEIEFVARLREARAFAGPLELRSQIARDISAAREVLAGGQMSG